MRRDFHARLNKFSIRGSLVAVLLVTSVTVFADEENWLHYGASLAGDRYASPSAISPETVDRLGVAWIYRTGDATNGREFDGNESKFRATPILVQGKLIGSTGFNRVFAVDAATGEELWKFDPKVDFDRSYSEMFTSRGVAAWISPSPSDKNCNTRIFLGTLDARLLAIDADTGAVCEEFGKDGQINLSADIPRYRKWDYSVTSPPTVVNDLVIVGSAIGDNGRAEMEPGVVRAFDVVDGSLVWSWDPIPRHKEHPGADTWEKVKRNRTGGANVWSVMSADAELDLVILPTTSPSPDFYGGMRLGDNAFSNSVVALRASTGEFVWGYQTIKHDLWDYDLAAQPLLFDHTASNGEVRPAVSQATKTGFVFVLDRETGKPLHPVEERAVPASDVRGEMAARTQPFPKLRLHPTDARPLELWNFYPAHTEACRKLTAGLRYEGIFTPPSLNGSLVYPGNAGGTNWGSMAYDKGAGVGYLVVVRMPTVVKLIPRDRFDAARRKGTLNGARAQHTSQSGTPFGMARVDLQYNHLPCLKGPWASLVAVDLHEGTVRWERPIGTISWEQVGEEAAGWGYPTSGGSMVTEGGVVFIATSSDGMFRGFDGSTGEELWTWKLPAGAHATPMGFRHEGNDYIVIAAGDSLAEGNGRGDHLIAFTLSHDSH